MIAGVFLDKMPGNIECHQGKLVKAPLHFDAFLGTIWQN